MCCSISQFLDDNIYMSKNDSYTQHSAQQPSMEISQGATAGPPTRGTYDTIHDPPLPRTVAADVTAPRHGVASNTAEFASHNYDILEANATQEEQQAYEVPVRTGRSAGSTYTEATETLPYSQLEHK